MPSTAPTTRLWLDRRGTKDLHWFGYRTVKTPMDMWIYQEIVTETRPEVIVECGTAWGSAARCTSSLFDLMGRGEVITIDIEVRGPARASLVTRSSASTDPAGSRTSGNAGRPGADDGHPRLWTTTSPTSPGSCGAYSGPGRGRLLPRRRGHQPQRPRRARPRPGPMEAVEAFLPAAPEFEVDRSRERFMLTLNPQRFRSGSATPLAARTLAGVSMKNSVKSVQRPSASNSRRYAFRAPELRLDGVLVVAAPADDGRVRRPRDRLVLAVVRAGLVAVVDPDFTIASAPTTASRVGVVRS